MDAAKPITREETAIRKGGEATNGPRGVRSTPRNPQRPGRSWMPACDCCQPLRTVAKTIPCNCCCDSSTIANHRSNRHRKPSHLSNHSQGCFQGDIEIFGAGAVIILFNAETYHFPAKECLCDGCLAPFPAIGDVPIVEGSGRCFSSRAIVRATVLPLCNGFTSGWLHHLG